MEAIYQFLYRPGIPLQVTGILIGLVLLGSHLFALLRPGITTVFLKAYPRNETIGVSLAIFCFAWTFVVWSTMDLGEFFRVEFVVQVVLIAGCIGVITHVKEFLAVRATGFFLILLAAPILNSAFLQEPLSRLLLVALAYAWAIIGMFWVGMPYLMRDQIRWLTREPRRYRIVAASGAVYGLVVLLCALTW